MDRRKFFETQDIPKVLHTGSDIRVLDMSEKIAALPLPTLQKRILPFAGLQGAGELSVLGDTALQEACGVVIAFTDRCGGVSSPPYKSLNMGMHVKDDPACVAANRERLLQALTGLSEGASKNRSANMPALVVPHQVHGKTILVREDFASPDNLQDAANEGCDALVVQSGKGASDCAPLLCFADCVPMIIVSPTGAFAVVHAGWRGVDNGIAADAVRVLAQREEALSDRTSAQLIACMNVYIGPHICGDCFEVSEELVHRFSTNFGPTCIVDDRHVDLARALVVQLVNAGIDKKRIVQADACTYEDTDHYYSYRAEGGTTGRHGAIALRL